MSECTGTFQTNPALPRALEVEFRPTKGSEASPLADEAWLEAAIGEGARLLLALAWIALALLITLALVALALVALALVALALVALALVALALVALALVALALVALALVALALVALALVALTRITRVALIRLIALGTRSVIGANAIDVTRVFLNTNLGRLGRPIQGIQHDILDLHARARGNLTDRQHDRPTSSGFESQPEVVTRAYAKELEVAAGIRCGALPAARHTDTAKRR